MYKMDTRIINIFNFLNKQRVPLLYSVPLCLKLKGTQINKVSESAGITRNMFYKILAGERSPNENVKKELNKLGIIPWN